ncbi:hypothetical protein VM1G_11695 [Cytospora mali]|uniref:Uncharacterized protein n=1 Tax=Cytospora mali TaxID=578113 RepID=A0A194W3B4_CYTMA|nr:hypothetical protein VM1G_11695 [Valsa mali]
METTRQRFMSGDQANKWTVPIIESGDVAATKQLNREQAEGLLHMSLSSLWQLSTQACTSSATLRIFTSSTSQGPHNHHHVALDGTGNVGGIGFQDYIRASQLGGRIPDWSEFIRQTWRLLKPGGYLELFDVSRKYTHDEDSEWRKASRMFDSVAKIYARSFNMVASLEIVDKLIEAGFTQVSSSSSFHGFDTPKGSLYLDSVLVDLAMINHLARPVGSLHKLNSLLESLRRCDLSTSGVTFCTVWAQKPFEYARPLPPIPISDIADGPEDDDDDEDAEQKDGFKDEASRPLMNDAGTPAGLALKL